MRKRSIESLIRQAEDYARAVDPDYWRAKRGAVYRRDAACERACRRCDVACATCYFALQDLLGEIEARIPLEPVLVFDTDAGELREAA